MNTLTKGPGQTTVSLSCVRRSLTKRQILEVSVTSVINSFQYTNPKMNAHCILNTIYVTQLLPDCKFAEKKSF